MKNSLNKLLDIIEQKSGHKTLSEFQNLFEASHYKHLMSFEKKIDALEENFYGNLNFAKNGKIENTSSGVMKLSFHLDFNLKTNDIKNVFDLFVNSTYHANPLGHFRNHAEFYAGVYSGPRYFAFHGDGNCFAISMIFQGFVKKVLQKDIHVYYGTLADRSYMHTYCMDNPYYVDADLKTFCLQDDIKYSMPVGLIYSLISYAGFDIFNATKEETRKRLFPSMTFEFMSDFYLKQQPAIYQKIPSLKLLKESFQKVFSNHSEIVDLVKDDYPWKKNYRKAVNKIVGNEEFFFSKIQEDHLMVLPKGAVFSIASPDNNELPEEIEDLSCIYFGRIPGLITQKVYANADVELISPEFPWMLVFENYFEFITINDKQFFPLKSRCGLFGILGMGDLESITHFAKDQFTYRLKLKKDCLVKIIFPINYRAIDSGLVKLKHFN